MEVKVPDERLLLSVVQVAVRVVRVVLLLVLVTDVVV
jgi:hypothetical protein